MVVEAEGGALDDDEEAGEVPGAEPGPGDGLGAADVGDGEADEGGDAESADDREDVVEGGVAGAPAVGAADAEEDESDEREGEGRDVVDGARRDDEVERRGRGDGEREEVAGDDQGDVRGGAVVAAPARRRGGRGGRWAWWARRTGRAGCGARCGAAAAGVGGAFVGHGCVGFRRRGRRERRRRGSARLPGALSDHERKPVCGAPRPVTGCRKGQRAPLPGTGGVLRSGASWTAGRSAGLVGAGVVGAGVGAGVGVAMGWGAAPGSGVADEGRAAGDEFGENGGGVEAFARADAVVELAGKPVAWGGAVGAAEPAFGVALVAAGGGEDAEQRRGAVAPRWRVNARR